MWNIELDRHREIMRAEAQAEARLIEQERLANMPKKQAGISIISEIVSKLS